MAAPKSAGSVPKQPVSSQSSDSTQVPPSLTKPPNEHAGVYTRMRRVSNGFLAEELTVSPTGELSIKQLGDWDLRMVVETKALNSIVRNTKG